MVGFESLNLTCDAKINVKIQITILTPKEMGFVKSSARSYKTKENKTAKSKYKTLSLGSSIRGLNLLPLSSYIETLSFAKQSFIKQI